ncbi:M23 family metallopeptidase [Ammoniphilus sp. CFH 90114]|uniref:M23 family metallopeptidase n=1 Tax=Ammoniphilus sp. CFH 90114 TaxID=2493665 RepID=UPI00100F7285|nr:M23 family metallopeptidase [Ammoniphilus sp. CFH 90114]RXT14726.1 M23 family metallopeptidase [Ammoniphilus sp. CFH 90114]
MSLDSIKRRREERLRELREQMRRGSEGGFLDEAIEVESPKRYSSSSYMATRREYSWDQEDDWGTKEEPVEPISSRFMMKAILSLFLLSFTFLIYKIDSPFTTPAKGFVDQVMTREYNFQGTMALLEKYVGTPSILPTIDTPMQGSPQPVWNQVRAPKKYVVPVSGKVAAPFYLDGKGIQIEAPGGSEIKAVDQGWVIFVGTKEGLGQTVIVRHENQLLSSYSSVDEIQVKEQDWVQPGQVIGKTKEGQTVYFSMQMNEQFMDPVSVITFD